MTGKKARKSDVLNVSPELDNPYVVTLSNGARVNIKPVPPYLIDRIRRTVTLPKPPVIEVKTAWGGSEEWINESDPAYKEALALAEEEQADKLWKAEFILGIEDEPPPDEEWTGNLTMFGVEIPEDPKERKLLWVETVLIAKGIDAWKLINAIRGAARPTKEEISELAESFRGDLSWLKAAAKEAESS